ncbi:hypothetical protein Agub_g11255, partial [Astrephomene gubernaculifera]
MPQLLSSFGKAIGSLFRTIGTVNPHGSSSDDGTHDWPQRAALSSSHASASSTAPSTARPRAANGYSSPPCNLPSLHTSGPQGQITSTDPSSPSLAALAAPIAHPLSPRHTSTNISISAPTTTSSVMAAATTNDFLPTTETTLATNTATCSTATPLTSTSASAPPPPPPLPTVATGNGCSDGSGHPCGSASPMASSFCRTSRVSLSDTSTSAAGEALRQASMTNRKAHFTRDNLVAYMRWVRASRGAMKLVGKSSSRSPHPQLLLRCEHWLEVTDEQHRYGSNLRVYFDYWVAEMEAAELTPPPSPALMSPSPSYTALVALAAQQQGQHQGQAGGQGGDAGAPAVAAAEDAVAEVQPVLQQQRGSGQVVAVVAAGCAAAAAAGMTVAHVGTTGAGPSRFSTDAASRSPVASGAAAAVAVAAAAPAAEESAPGSEQSHGQLPSSQLHHQPHHPHLHPHPHHHTHQLQPQLRNKHTHSHHQQPPHHPHHFQVKHLHHHFPHHHHHHHQHQHYTSQQPHVVSSSSSSRPIPQQPPSLGEGSIEQGTSPCDVASGLAHAAAHDSSGHLGVTHPQPHSNNPHRQDMIHNFPHLNLREGSVQLGAGSEDGNSHADGSAGPDTGGARCSMDEASGLDPPLSPQSPRPPFAQQLRRHSCGEASPLSSSQLYHSSCCSAAAPTPAPRPHSETLPPAAAMAGGTAAAAAGSGATTVAGGLATLPVPVPGAAAASAAAAAAALGCSSPRRASMVCSPSKRFMMAAMIDMGGVEEQQPEQEQQLPLQGVQGGQEDTHSAGVAGEREEPQQQQHEHGQEQVEWGGFSCGAGSSGGGGGGGGAQGLPPATPPPLCGQQQQQPQQSDADAGAAIAAKGSGRGSGSGSAFGFGEPTGVPAPAYRVAKLLSNRGSVGNGSNFFRWLDNGPGLEVDLGHLGVPRAKLDAERVKYLTPLELLEYELDVDMESGLLRYKRSGKLLHTGPDGRCSLDEHRRPPT